MDRRTGRGAGAAGAPPARGGIPGGLGAARLVEETRERFVREIVARVALDTIEELFLFPPMRQGGVESGVAVVAARIPLPPAPADAPAGLRHTVFAASYRLTLKGPERGRWALEMREEADAPLVTVEEVVRGVQRRAGDAADSQRLDAAGIARLLRLPDGAE